MFRSNSQKRWEKLKKTGRPLIGLLFILLSFTIVSVSAYIYEQASQTVTQTIREIATLNLQSSTLGNIEEGETKVYTKTDVPSLGGIISVITTKANVYLHLNSDLDALSGSYDTYDITMRFATVPAGSVLHAVGNVACTLSLAQPDFSSIDLDAAGDWGFDFEITTTARSVSSDTPTAVTIAVTAESTA